MQDAVVSQKGETPESSVVGRWFYSPGFDLTFFHIPVWLGWLIVLVLAPRSLLQAKVPVWAWVFVVLLVDVGHVWSTIYRTYWDRESRQRNRDLLYGIPLACFFGGFAVAYISDDLFWTVLAYIAVFHFIKQQYGLTALHHARMYQNAALLPQEMQSDARDALGRLRKLDQIAIYTATLFPVLYWHIHLPKKIWWFSKWDFLPYLTWFRALKESPVGMAIYQGGAVLALLFWVGTMFVWLGAHILACRRFGLHFPLGKVLWVLGTYFNWYLGIVHLDSPFAFTLTNVIAHGIPYYGLVFVYSENAWRAKQTPWHHFVSKRAVAVCVFFVPIFMFSFWEEYLWDMFVRGGEYKQFFTIFLSYPIPKVTHKGWLAFWLALLSLPQITHYFLDRYLWRANDRNPHLKEYLHL